MAHDPHRVVDFKDASREEAKRTIKMLRPALETAAGEPISTMIGSREPMRAVEDAINRQDFDEVVLAMRPNRLARGFHFDLASRVKDLGPDVTVVNVGSRSPRAVQPAPSDGDRKSADAPSPWPHSRQEAEVEAIVRALRGYGVLTRARLAEVSGAAHWSDSGFRGALTQAISSGRIRGLGENLYEISEPPSR